MNLASSAKIMTLLEKSGRSFYMNGREDTLLMSTGEKKASFTSIFAAGQETLRPSQLLRVYGASLQFEYNESLIYLINDICKSQKNNDSIFIRIHKFARSFSDEKVSQAKTIGRLHMNPDDWLCQLHTTFH